MTGSRRIYLNVSRALFDLPPASRDRAIRAFADALGDQALGAPSAAGSAGEAGRRAQGRHSWQRAGGAPNSVDAQVTKAPASSEHTLR